MRCSPRKPVYLFWEEEEEALQLFFLFGGTGWPDRMGTNNRLFDVSGHHRRGMWTPTCRGMCKFTVRADSAGESQDSACSPKRFFR